MLVTRPHRFVASHLLPVDFRTSPSKSPANKTKISPMRDSRNFPQSRASIIAQFGTHLSEGRRRLLGVVARERTEVFDVFRFQTGRKKSQRVRNLVTTVSRQNQHLVSKDDRTAKNYIQLTWTPNSRYRALTRMTSARKKTRKGSAAWR